MLSALAHFYPPGSETARVLYQVYRFAARWLRIVDKALLQARQEADKEIKGTH